MQAEPVQTWQILHPASHSCISSPRKPEKRKHEVVREGLRQTGDMGVRGRAERMGLRLAILFPNSSSP